MRLTQFLAAAAAFSLAATPAVAVPTNPAAKLSLGNQDAGDPGPADAPTKARSSTYLLAGIGVVAVVVAALAMGGNGDSTPASA